MDVIEKKVDDDKNDHDNDSNKIMKLNVVMCKEYHLT